MVKLWKLIWFFFFGGIMTLWHHQMRYFLKSFIITFNKRLPHTLILEKLWFFYFLFFSAIILGQEFFFNKITINAQELERKAFSSRWISNHNWNCWVDHTTSLLRKKYRINLFTDIFSSLLCCLSSPLFLFLFFPMLIERRGFGRSL